MTNVGAAYELAVSPAVVIKSMALKNAVRGILKRAVVPIGFLVFGSGNATIGVLCWASMTNVCQTADLSGYTDFAARVNACVSALANSGGTVDARGSIGSQTCSSANITIPKWTTLLLSPGTNISGTCQITMNSYSSIEGFGGVGTYADGTAQNAETTWTYTGTSGNFITLQGGSTNAYGTKLANVRFIGPCANTGPCSNTGNGLYASPGSGYSNVQVTLDHVTFQQFGYDGIHLEDNVYMVGCYGCAAMWNGRDGWYQATNNTTTAPSQVRIWDGKFNSNGLNGSSYTDVYAGGGSSAGELLIAGSSVADDLSPISGSNSSCMQFVATSSQQLNVWLISNHIEHCGTTVGGQMIDWNVANGIIDLEDNTFINPSTYVGYVVNLDSNFDSIANVGPGNQYSVPSAPYAFNNANSTSTGTFTCLDNFCLSSSIKGAIGSGETLNFMNNGLFSIGKTFANINETLNSTVNTSTAAAGFYPTNGSNQANFSLYGSSPPVGTWPAYSTLLEGSAAGPEILDAYGSGNYIMFQANRVNTMKLSTSGIQMQNGSTIQGTPAIAGVATLSSGTSTVSNSNACSPAASCVYKLTNCGKNSSSAIGTLEIGTVSAGTSFVVNSLGPTGSVAIGDASAVCWQIN